MSVNFREDALAWWRSLHSINDENPYKWKDLLTKYQLQLKLNTWKNRQYFDLTGREIEEIYKIEIIKQI